MDRTYYEKYYHLSAEIYVTLSLVSTVDNCDELRNLVKEDAHYNHKLYRVDRVKCIVSEKYFNFKEIFIYLAAVYSDFNNDLALKLYSLVLPAATWEIGCTIIQAKCKNKTHYRHIITDIDKIQPIPGELKALPPGLHSVCIEKENKKC